MARCSIFWSLPSCGFFREGNRGTSGSPTFLFSFLSRMRLRTPWPGDYQSITGGIVLVATIVAWSYALDVVAWRFPSMCRFLRPAPLRLIREGEMLRKNMRREFITEEDLTSMLREQGIQDIHQVRDAFLEADGQLSVITRGGEEAQRPSAEPTASIAVRSTV